MTRAPGDLVSYFERLADISIVLPTGSQLRIGLINIDIIEELPDFRKVKETFRLGEIGPAQVPLDAFLVSRGLATLGFGELSCGLIGNWRWLKCEEVGPRLIGADEYV
jgi:hypothetical protein